jgi:TRAP-type mannitol/chloroaromatic compound transport system permease large subunit
MGYLVEEAGLMDRLFRGFQKLLGGIRGSLYLGVLVTGTIFAAATGIIRASVTLLGIMAGTAMKRAGYDPSLSAGVITAAGCLGDGLAPVSWRP